MMKILYLAIAIILLAVTLSYGASSQVVTKYSYPNGWVELNIAWTAHTDGSYTSYTTTTEDTNFIKGRLLCQMVTNPGATAPTADYDITVSNSDGADLLGTAGNNRHTSTTEVTYPIVDTTTTQRACVPVTGALTLAIANNSQNGAVGVIRLIFK